MAMYFFDTRDDGKILRDDEGFDIETFSAVRIQATKSLAELAADVLPGSLRRCLGVDVRDAAGHLVLIAELVFEARILSAPSV